MIKCNYNVAMITRIVKIGNSQGIRIPKILLEQSGLTDEEVELEVKKDQLIIRRKKSVRQNWASAFQAMAKNRDDRLLDQDLLLDLSSWDAIEWEW